MFARPGSLFLPRQQMCYLLKLNPRFSQLRQVSACKFSALRVTNGWGAANKTKSKQIEKCSEGPTWSASLPAATWVFIVNRDIYVLTRCLPREVSLPSCCHNCLFRSGAQSNWKITCRKPRSIACSVGLGGLQFSKARRSSVVEPTRVLHLWTFNRHKQVAPLLSCLLWH